MATDEPNRRAFLAGAGAAAVAGLAAACSTDESSGRVEPTPTAIGSATASGGADQAPVTFADAHQQGVLLAPQAAGLVAAFDVLDTDRAALTTTMQQVSDEIRDIMAGTAPAPLDAIKPPADSGALDASSTSAGTAVTLAVGASLFDDRFDLGDRRPRELIAMPRFFNDRQVREEISHGDLALTIAGPNQQAVIAALHRIVRVSDRRLRLRWVQEGWNDLLPPEPDRVAPTRNLMGFRDGSSNLDVDDSAVMDEHVWVGADDGEPEWAVGGTYQAVRLIRMLIEFWATAALVRQEQIFGRHRESGAPLGQATEAEEPTFVADPADESVPRRSHMRLANPRTPGTGRILRRGFSYSNGVDARDATLDQGLVFLAYQRSLTRGFLAAQTRLEREPLEDYVKPQGGGLFYVLPGPGDSGWLGESLLA